MGENFFRQILAGLCLATVGIFILVESVRLDYTSDVCPGPGFLPLWLGIIIIGLSGLLIFTTLRKRITPETTKLDQAGRSRRPLIIWLAIMLSIGLLGSLGFYASFGVLAAFLVLAMERRAVSTALTVAIGSVLGFYLVFTRLLHVPLPTNPWGF
jgi:putative tricarboxylic transport membrane protein